jgi:enoyl-CoA hydratase/carnithine racemase
MENASTQPDVLLRETDSRGVVWLTLNRPQAFNALSDALLAALQQQIDTLMHDDTARVVIVRGSGRAFCAGHDLKELRARSAQEEIQALFARCGKVMTGLMRLPQPVIAQVHGIATAAGCQLVASCDLAVAAQDARFAVSGVNYGLFCSTPGVALSRNVPRKQAMEMLLTGEFIDAATAQQRGLINRVAAPDLLEAEVDKLVSSILDKPAAAVRLGKALFYRQAETGIDAAYQLAAQTMTCNLLDDCAQEGVQAFIDKRQPTWRRQK